jgi:hypothetical protein
VGVSGKTGPVALKMKKARSESIRTGWPRESWDFEKVLRTEYQRSGEYDEQKNEAQADKTERDLAVVKIL